MTDEYKCMKCTMTYQIGEPPVFSNHLRACSFRCPDCGLVHWLYEAGKGNRPLKVGVTRENAEQMGLPA